jgi:hypothetical protein
MEWCGMASFRFPFKTLLATGLLSFVLVDYPPLKVRLATDGDMVKKAEFYPLSSFSMYSTFSETPFLVYVTDGRGGKVAIDTSLKTHASELKKTYESLLKRAKQKAKQGGRLTDVPPELKAEAGRATLELLKTRPGVQAWLATQPDKKLVLHEVVLTAGKDGVEKLDAAVAGL